MNQIRHIAPPPLTPRHMAANPILDPRELKAHLNLLRAFYDLKSQVEGGSKLELDAHTSSPEERWESFVQVSVGRYITPTTVCGGVDRGVADSTDGLPVSRWMIAVSSRTWSVRLWTCVLCGTRLC